MHTRTKSLALFLMVMVFGSAPAAMQQSFSSPEAAVEAFLTALPKTWRETSDPAYPESGRIVARK